MQTLTTAPRPSLRLRWLARGIAALLAVTAVGALPTTAQAGVFVSVNIAPPPLPVYTQPVIPAPGYIWTPGYWAWDGGGYYWVPGTWVLAPYAGALWTPGYWGWSDGVYLFHAGYWGLHVGFYGGVNYGYGYGGYGYNGGYWRGGGFYYNRTVNHVTNNITNVYNKTVINNTTIVNRTSFNGGPGGINARATAQQQAWSREPHTAPVAAQLQQRSMASRMPSMRATANHGMPPIAATPRAGTFSGHGVIAAHGATPMAMDASERRINPSMNHAPQQPGALRSASFAPHANPAMQGGEGSRYTPSSTSRGKTRPESSYENPRSRGSASYQPSRQSHRGNAYPPSNERQPAYRPSANNGEPMPRQPPRYEQTAPRHEPAPYRPTAPQQYAHAPAEHAHAAPAAHEERHEDKHH